MDGVETSEGMHVAKFIQITPSEYVSLKKGFEDDETNTIRHNKNDEDFSSPYSDVRLVVTEGNH